MSRREVRPLLEYCDEEIVVEFPFATGEAPQRFEGRDAVIEGMSVIPAMFSEFFLEPLRLFEARTSDTVIMEAKSTGTLADGQAYSNRYVMLFRFQGDKVRLWREFYDPMRVPTARAGDGGVSA